MRVLLVGGVGNTNQYFDAFIRKCWLPVDLVLLNGREQQLIEQKLACAQDRELILIGFSAGVNAALKCIEKNPERRNVLRDVIFVCPINVFHMVCTHNAKAQCDPSSAPLRSRWWFDLRIVKFAARYIPRLFEWCYLYFSPHCPPSVRADMFSRPSIAVNALYDNMICSNPYTGLRCLRKVGVPVRFLFSSEDRMEAYASVLREFDAGKVVERSCSHHVFLEEPEMISDLLFRWSRS